MGKKKLGRPARENVKTINVRLDKGLHAKLYACADKKGWSIRKAVEAVIEHFFSSGGDKK
jgi:predicted HicB family RNase H-like nuclease